MYLKKCVYLRWKTRHKFSILLLMQLIFCFLDNYIQIIHWHVLFPSIWSLNGLKKSYMDLHKTRRTPDEHSHEMKKPLKHHKSMKVAELISLHFLRRPFGSWQKLNLSLSPLSFCSVDSCYLLFPSQGLIYNWFKRRSYIIHFCLLMRPKRNWQIQLSISFQLIDTSQWIPAHVWTLFYYW